MRTAIHHLLHIVTGNLLLAFGIAVFAEPSGIINGGSAGLGLFVYRISGISLSTTSAVINTLCFLLGLLILGKQFAGSTLLSTILFPPLLRLCELLPYRDLASEHLLICAVLSGICAGLGLSLVIMVNASTGGLDIPPLVASRYTGLTVGKLMLLQNGLIILLQVLSANRSQILYGLIGIVLTSLLLDVIVTRAQRQQLLKKEKLTLEY